MKALARPKRRDARVFGLLMVRDAVDVVELNLRHHLALGLERILVVDNGSTDGTAEVLHRLERELPLRVEADAGPFRQDLVFTRLAREAAGAGADWVLPIDADEFWAAPRDLTRLLAHSRAGALRAEVTNFVQRREEATARPAGLLTMTMRVAEPLPQQPQTRRLLDEHRLSFLELDYPAKHVVRAGTAVALKTGNHVVSGIRGRVERCSEIMCLHAPLRSRSTLAGRAEHGRRVEARGYAADESWHVRRWRRLADAGALEDDWPAHSYSGGCLDVYGRRVPLTVDTRLRDALAPLLSS